MSDDGHGHVRPRADGMRARCGGPAICSDCAAEAARLGVAYPLLPPKPEPDLSKLTIPQLLPAIRERKDIVLAMTVDGNRADARAVFACVDELARRLT